MWLADAEKNVPDPPSTLSALPNGVSTESSATEPTTKTLMLPEEGERTGAGHPAPGACSSHSFRSSNAEEIQAVSEDKLRRAREHQTGLHDRLRLVQHVIFVIPEMNLSSCVVQIIRDEVRLEPPGSTLDEVRIVE